MTGIHIHAPLGDYIGQVRGRGQRKWATVTGDCITAELAMSDAVLKMKDMNRARVLYTTRCGYYPPAVVMECKR